VEGKDLVQLAATDAPIFEILHRLVVEPAALVVRLAGGFEEGAEALLLGKLAGEKPIDGFGGRYDGVVRLS
jgi:hypothetical protein